MSKFYDWRLIFRMTDYLKLGKNFVDYYSRNNCENASDGYWMKEEYMKEYLEEQWELANVLLNNSGSYRGILHLHLNIQEWNIERIISELIREGEDLDNLKQRIIDSIASLTEERLLEMADIHHTDMIDNSILQGVVKV